MPVLTAADQPIYFPTVTQTGAALDGLMALAQALCESSYGANRPLELQQHSEIITINLKYLVGTLSYYPIAALPSMSVWARIMMDASFGRLSLHQWLPLASDDYLLDVETGELRLGGVASEVKVVYSAGFDFSLSSAEVKSIKAIAGQALTYFANYQVGLDSYLNNPAGEGGVESYNLVRPDQYLSAILLPLRRYMPRRSCG
jgi:hypothetical protein